MLLLPRVTPAQFRARFQAFDEAAKYLQLSPPDRNLMWREHTGDQDFYEWPVPIEHFIDDPFYSGTELRVRPKIREFMADFTDPEQVYELFTFVAGIGSGKALALDTPLPTPTGWTTMGEVRPGDLLLDERGEPTRVDWVSEIREDRDCYRVMFDDRTSIVADAEHQWTTLDYRARKQLRRRAGGDVVFDWRGHWDDAHTTTTEDLRHTLRHGKIQQTNHAIPCARALELPAARLPVDPYVLGAWLGDGITIHGAITSADPAIIDRIERAGQPAKMRASTAHKTAPTYQLTGLAPRLREAGVLGLKHIPTAYLRASRAQRLDLLRGLMDADGFTTSAGGVGIDQSREALADSVVELVRSLGWKAYVRKARTYLDGRDCGPRWRIAFTPDEPVFTLRRKLDTWHPHRHHLRHSARAIVAIEPVASVPVRCLGVRSPRHLFLAGEGMVPTHNSFSASVLITYTLYMLNCLRRPQRYLSSFPGTDLSGDAELVVLNASAAGARQSIKVVYGEVYEKVQSSPWFTVHAPPYPDKRSELEWPHRIRFSPGTSSAKSALGFNVFAFVIDEAAFGIENLWTDTNQVRDLFDALNQRRRSRFGHLGWGGLFTSPQSEHAYVELIAGEGAFSGSEVMVRRISTWEAKDELVPGATVFLLKVDPNQGPSIVEENLKLVAPGLCQRANGELVRFGPIAPDQRVAEEVARAAIVDDAVRAA